MLLVVEVLSIDLRAEVTVDDTLTEVVIDVFDDVLANIVVGDSVVTFDNMEEFALSPPYTVDVLVDSWTEVVGNIDASIDVRVTLLIGVFVSGVWVGTIFDVVTDFSIVVLGDVDVLAAVTTALEFTM